MARPTGRSSSRTRSSGLTEATSPQSICVGTEEDGHVAVAAGTGPRCPRMSVPPRVQSPRPAGLGIICPKEPLRFDAAVVGNLEVIAVVIGCR